MHQERLNVSICTNCQKKGHGFKKCKKPIVSFGILAYKSSDEGPEFLLVQRKDTMGYIDLIRGRYDEERKFETIKIFIEEMIPEEKTKLLTMTFDQLWFDLWVNHNSRTFKEDSHQAKIKFQKLDIKNLLSNTYCKWDTQEYGIPKGRRSKSKEMDIECACREFFEETGIKSMDYKIIDVPPLEEVFTGSNGVVYRHVYYLARYTGSSNPRVDESNKIQISEIRSLGWFGIKKAINTLRSYDFTKKHVLIEAWLAINKI